jgi:type IV pilus biogenesis protein CpaD/CtpE
MTKKVLLVVLLAFTAASVSGCIGRTAKQTTNVKATTTGQELADLQKALDDGLINQAEFDKKRKEILKNG